MPLNKDTLGTALFTARETFSNKTIQQLEQEYGSLNAAKLAAAKADAEAIIEHFKANGLIRVNTTGTATAQTGTGTIE